MTKFNFYDKYEELKGSSYFNDAVLYFHTSYRDMMKRKTVKEEEEKALEFLKIMVENLEEAMKEKKRV